MLVFTNQKRKNKQIIDIVGSLQLSKSSRLLQWLVFFTAFATKMSRFRVLLKEEWSLKNDHILLLTSTNDTENENITFLQ